MAEPEDPFEQLRRTARRAAGSRPEGGAGQETADPRSALRPVRPRSEVGSSAKPLPATPASVTPAAPVSPTVRLTPQPARPVVNPVSVTSSSLPNADPLPSPAVSSRAASPTAPMVRPFAVRTSQPAQPSSPVVSAPPPVSSPPSSSSVPVSFAPKPVAPMAAPPMENPPSPPGRPSLESLPTLRPKLSSPPIPKAPQVVPEPRLAPAATAQKSPAAPRVLKFDREESEPAPAVVPAVAKGPRLVADNQGLVIKNLGKRYKKRPVVRDISMTVQRGEAVGLLGPNGAGKTTCFHMVVGLVTPDYGVIALDGTDISDLPMYRRSRLGIGYLPQEASIFRGLSVEQNINAVLESIEPNRERRDAYLEALLAEFNVTHLRHTPALALSGGERRRVEIARALASQPSFILLDEPLAGIDPIAVRDIRDLVSHLKDRGLGVLITDHNVRETLDIVDRAYILHDGKVLMEGAPRDIVNDQDVRRVYLGEKFSL